jgi:predicted transcriptional regulator
MSERPVDHPENICNVRVPRESYRKLKHLADDIDCSVRSLATEAIDDLIVKYEKSSLPPCLMHSID